MDGQVVGGRGDGSLQDSTVGGDNGDVLGGEVRSPFTLHVAHVDLQTTEVLVLEDGGDDGGDRALRGADILGEGTVGGLHAGAVVDGGVAVVLLVGGRTAGGLAGGGGAGAGRRGVRAVLGREGTGTVDAGGNGGVETGAVLPYDGVVVKDGDRAPTAPLRSFDTGGAVGVLRAGVLDRGPLRGEGCRLLLREELGLGLEELPLATLGVEAFGEDEGHAGGEAVVEGGRGGAADGAEGPGKDAHFGSFLDTEDTFSCSFRSNQPELISVLTHNTNCPLFSVGIDDDGGGLGDLGLPFSLHEGVIDFESSVISNNKDGGIIPAISHAICLGHTAGGNHVAGTVHGITVVTRGRGLGRTSGGGGPSGAGGTGGTGGARSTGGAGGALNALSLAGRQVGTVTREDLVALPGGLVAFVGGGEARVDAILEGDTTARGAGGHALEGGVVALVTITLSVLEVLQTSPGFPAGGRVGGVSGLSGASGAEGSV